MSNNVWDIHYEQSAANTEYKNIPSPKPDDATATRYSYIVAKYQHKTFLRALCHSDLEDPSDVSCEEEESPRRITGAELQHALIQAAKSDDVARCLLCIAHGALLKFLPPQKADSLENTEVIDNLSGVEPCTTAYPLHAAAASGSICCCTLLIHNGVDTFLKDECGRFASDVAKSSDQLSITSYLTRKMESSNSGSSKFASTDGPLVSKLSPEAAVHLDDDSTHSSVDYKIGPIDANASHETASDASTHPSTPHFDAEKKNTQHVKENEKHHSHARSEGSDASDARNSSENPNNTVLSVLTEGRNAISSLLSRDGFLQKFSNKSVPTFHKNH